MAAPMSDPASDIPLIIQWANFYADKGFSVIPTAVGEKRPGLPWEVWQKERPDKNQILLWLTGLYRSSGIGLVTGAVSGNIFVVDPDAGEGKQGLENLDDVQMMHDDLPTTWSSKTGGGGRHYFFRAPPGIRIKTGKNIVAQDVDVRGEGGFLVLPPSIHPSGRSYEWIPGLDPATTAIAEAPDWLLTIVRDDEGTTPSRSDSPPVSGGDFNAFGRRIDGREEYMRDLLWARLIEERRTCPFPLTQDVLEKVLADCWSVFERKAKARGESLAGDGRGVDEMRRKLKYAAKKWDTRIAAEAGKPRPAGTWEEEVREPPKQGEAPPLTTINIVAAFPIDPQTIPPRPWIIPGLLIRNHVSVLVAPPGAGKSLLTLQVGLMASVGMQWAGWVPRKQSRVLVINSEDDTDEMRRRLVAAAAVMKIDQALIADNIFLAADPETIVIARTEPKTKAVLRTPLVNELIKVVQDLRIDIIVVDPFAETFEGDENSNSELKWAAILWREIARKTRCSVFLVHHTRKYSAGMTGDADAARGAGALIGVARVVSTLFAMSDAEAEVFGVLPDQRHRYVRFDDAKANLNLITGEARWFEKVSQPVGNAGLLPGDDAGVLVPWSPPGVFDGTSIQTLNQILDVMNAGILDDDGRPTGALYSPYKRSTKRWAGSVISDGLGCSEERSAKILKTWMETGLVFEVEYSDSKQSRKGVKVDFSKRPGAPA